MYRASVIIPVYNAEKTLERCVESLLYGRERNLEVLLLDDCSKDGSWARCQTLAEKYDHVRAFRNETNRGVSYTRNRGLDAATGEYILFVDSDDWVSGEYAAILLDEAEKDVDSMPVCGYHFLDQTRGVRQDYVWDRSAEEVTVVERRDLFGLLDKTLLQQLWTKVFRREAITAGNIRFDERMSMGEDFQFVLDYIEASGIGRFRMVNRALYYYIRYGNGSLMSQFGLVETADEFARLEKLYRLSGSKAAYEAARSHLKENYLYHIMRSNLAKTEKLAYMECLTDDARCSYRYHNRIIAKERVLSVLKWCSRILKRVQGKWQTIANRIKVRRLRRTLKTEGFTILSQNCIGGVLYHDMGMEFLSPTINLYFDGPDFVRFMEAPKEYLSLIPAMEWEEYPVGHLGDVTVRFLHYTSCTQALDAWQRRKVRVNYEKILVLCTDMEGFTQEVFDRWKELPYSKVLFTAHQDYAGDENSIYYEKYRDRGAVPDLIPKREFYKDQAVIRAINNLSRTANDFCR